MSEEKDRTTLNIGRDCIRHAKDYKINMSEFFTEEYRRKYLSLESKQEQLVDINQQQAALEAEITQIKERMEVTRKTLTEREQRYLSTVKPRQREGRDMSAMWRFFNNEYNRSYSLAEFQELVDLYERQAEKRAAYAISAKRRKK